MSTEKKNDSKPTENSPQSPVKKNPIPRMPKNEQVKEYEAPPSENDYKIYNQD